MATRSKAEAESDELPVWEKLFKMLLNVEADEQHVSSLDADNYHSGCTVGTYIFKKTSKSLETIRNIYCSMSESTPNLYN